MSLLALETLCRGLPLARLLFCPASLLARDQLRVTFLGQLGRAEVADILSGKLAGGGESSA